MKKFFLFLFILLSFPLKSLAISNYTWSTIDLTLETSSNLMSKNIDDNSNSILIVDKENKKVVERISSEELSVLVNYLANSQGSIVNKRY